MPQDRTAKPSWVTRIRWSLKRRGVFGTLRLALLKAPRRVAGWLWDRRHGVETARIAELDDLDIPSDNVAYGIRYQPTPTGAFRRVIRNLGIRCDQYNFIDFGSGKGRTLLLASELPFRNVIGVEFAPQLHKVAEENIRSFRGRQRCRQIQSICRDAALYRLPPGNSVLFFNFPFHEPVMRSVLAAIHESVRGSRAEIIIVNYEPTPSIARLFEGNTAFTMVRQSRECAVYRSTPRHDWGPPATALDAHAHGGS